MDFLVFRENLHVIGLDIWSLCSAPKSCSHLGQGLFQVSNEILDVLKANTGKQKQSTIVHHLDKFTEDEPAIELLLPSVVNISVLRPKVTSLG